MLSIITPHWNDLDGIENLFTCLQKQESAAWEWVIVDDFSTVEIQEQLKEFVQKNSSFPIYICLNQHKQNASVCRNQGAALAHYDTLVFLDSDDRISSKFVLNRQVKVEEFIVFQNMVIENEVKQSPYSLIKDDFLNHFLKAKFAWQTTCILFNKQFFLNWNGFDTNLKLLQDVEISIRILLVSSKYSIITDNEVDFFYKVTPIDIQKRTVEKVADSVNYLVTKLTNNHSLTRQQQRYLAGYYFLLMRYFVRSSTSADLVRVKESLQLFYKQNCINFIPFLVGRALLVLYSLKWINETIFLKFNRFIFKK